MCRFEQKGFGWAQNEATPSQLSRLAELAKGICPTDWDSTKSVDLSNLPEFTEGMCVTDWDRWFTMCSNNAYTAAERLFFVLNPDQDGDREAAAEFWGEHLADHEVQDFADGALIYLEMRDTDASVRGAKTR